MNQLHVLQLVRFVPRTRVAVVVIVIAASGVMGRCQLGLIGLIGAGSRAQGPYLSETIATEIGPASVRTIGCLDVGLVPFERNRHHCNDEVHALSPATRGAAIARLDRAWDKAAEGGRRGDIVETEVPSEAKRNRSA